MLVGCIGRWVNSFLLLSGFDGFCRGPSGILCLCLWDILMVYVSIVFCFEHILGHSQVCKYFTLATNWWKDILLLIFSLFSPETGNGVVFPRVLKILKLFIGNVEGNKELTATSVWQPVDLTLEGISFASFLPWTFDIFYFFLGHSSIPHFFLTLCFLFLS